MTRVSVNQALAAALLVSAAFWSACGASGKTNDRPAAPPQPVAVAPVAAVEHPISRYIRVTGTLMAEEQADLVDELQLKLVPPLKAEHRGNVQAVINIADEAPTGDLQL